MIFVIILASGEGSRFQSKLPKQYIPIPSESNLNAVEACIVKFYEFCNCKIICVVNPDHEKYYRNMKSRFESVDFMDVDFIYGGKTRFQSSKNAIMYVNERYEKECATVLIHDAARAFFTCDFIKDILAHDGTVIPFMPIVDTVKTLQNGVNIDRESIGRVATPQKFEFSEIYEAYLKVGDSEEGITDDLEVWRLCNPNGNIKWVSCTKNVKITHPSDLLQMPEFRSCLGVDFHQMKSVEGGVLVVGGVKIPCDRVFEAHSDGDVLLHALTDAILSVNGQGSIGVHFKNTDERWKGADSTTFVRHAISLLGDWKITHIDATIIAQSPKIMSYAEQIVDAMKGITACGSVNLKAVTPEFMGSLGREEGICAQVTVSAMKYR